MDIVCGQRGCKSTVEGDTAPERCPVCNQPLIGYHSATAAGSSETPDLDPGNEPDPDEGADDAPDPA